MQPDMPTVEPDPILLCTAHKKERFYIFSRREPEDVEGAAHGRDVFNEPLTREQILAAEAEIMTSVNLPKSAVIHTTKVKICRLLSDVFKFDFRVIFK